MSASAQARSVSRRRLLGAAAAGCGLLVAGCQSRTLRSRVKKGAVVAPSDVEVLNQLLDLEYSAIAGYAAGIPLLSRARAKDATQFLGQEVTHASTLAGLIKQAGGKPVKPRPTYDLGHPSGESEILGLLHRLEGAQISGYVRLVPLLSPGKLRSTAAAIAANDAQHVAILRQTLGRPPVPAALVTGRE